MNHKMNLDRRSKYSIMVIRQALFELLETKDLDEITVVDICRKADVNRGTFYKYYRDVPDLYDKTEDSLVEELHALAPQTEVIDFLNSSFFYDILNTLANNQEYTYIARNRSFSERLAQKLLTFYVPHLQHIIQTNCPDMSAQSSKLLLEYILGGCIQVISYWLKDGMQISIDDINTELSTMLSHSLSMHG